MKKIRLVSMVLTASLLLSACGGEAGQSEPEVSKTNKNAVLKEEVNAFKLEEGDISQIVVAGDTLYVEQYIYNYDVPQAREEVAVAEVSSTAVAEVEEVIVEEAVEEKIAVE